MTPVDPADYLFVDAWKDIASAVPGVAYRSTEEAVDFFRGDPPRCVLVSGCCDFSVRLQADHHPNADLVKLAYSLDYEELSRERENYWSVKVGPAAREGCVPTHRYVLKADRFAHATFGELPAGVARWYTTNLDVEHPRMRWLPFGLNNDGPGSGHIPGLAGRPKKGLLYVNFQHNTWERVRLKRFFSQQPWATVRMTADVPVDQYLAEVAEHKFVLCPFGNGLDCYRTYEAIYLGAVPVLPASRFASYFHEHRLPVTSGPADDFYLLTGEFLDSLWEKFASTPWDYAAVTAPYWKRELARAAEELLA